LDYADHKSSFLLPEPIKLELDEVEDNSVIDWFYSHRPRYLYPIYNSTKCCYWRLTDSVILNLSVLSNHIISEIQDPNYFYMFNIDSFITAKSLNLSIPGGPKFEPMFHDKSDYDVSRNDFNDPKQIIVRCPIRTEYKIAFPFLYNNRVRKVVQTKYYDPVSFSFRDSSLKISAFHYDSLLHPIPDIKKSSNIRFTMSNNGNDYKKRIQIRSFLVYLPILTNNTLKVFTLLSAHPSFKRRTGRT